MCDPVTMGVATFAQGAFGALQGASQAKARNRAKLQNYEHALKVRKHEWYQQLSVWGAKRNKYFQDITENDLAAQRGYSQAQVGLNRVWEGAMQSNEGALIKFLQNHGKYTAAGRTGRSIKRLGTLERGMLERHAGRQYYNLTRAKHSFKQNVEDIRQKQISHRSKLHAKVAFEPMPDLPPPQPEFENQSAMPGLLMAAGSGIMSYAGAGGKFGRGPKLGGFNSKVTGLGGKIDSSLGQGLNIPFTQQAGGRFSNVWGATKQWGRGVLGNFPQTINWFV